MSRPVPGTEYEALLKSLDRRLAALERRAPGRIKIANGSQIGGVIFESERDASGNMTLYAKDAERGVRVLIATIT